MFFANFVFDSCFVETGFAFVSVFLFKENMQVFICCYMFVLVWFFFFERNYSQDCQYILLAVRSSDLVSSCFC